MTGARATAEVIDGRAVAKQLADEVRGELAELAARGITCGLATVLVGTDHAAAAYERRLRQEAHELGITYRHCFLGTDTDQDTVERVVRDLGTDPAVHGVLVLRPLPAHLDEGAIFQALDPVKDIEAVHPENAGLLALGTPRFVPAVPNLSRLRRSGSRAEETTTCSPGARARVVPPGRCAPPPQVVVARSRRVAVCPPGRTGRPSSPRYSLA